jgi:eukaryotic-like serine/threonine-protein kinase
VLAVGQRVQRFEVTALLGSGGMGAVYRARDTQLMRDVAIKLLARPAAEVANQLSTTQTLDLRTRAPASSADILHEAQMMARLSHPNVLPVYEVGLVAGAVMLVMEHVAGADLASWLATPRETADILAVFAQAARGLAAAHACGIVHGDFKPNNVLVGDDGRVRVADFGLSRLADRPSDAMVRMDVGGTPHYMAPELWHGQLATPASDVFALCVAVADALAGRELPPRLAELLASGECKDPAARPALAAVLAALDGRPQRGRRAWWIAAAAVAVGAAVVGVASLLVLRATAAATVECPPPPSPVSGRFDDAHRQALRAALAKNGHDQLARIVANFDEQQRDIDDHWQATCRAGELTQAQAAVRRSCLERREIELGTKVEHFIESRPNEPTLVDRAQVYNVADCDAQTTPPLPIDRGPVLALFRRFNASEDLRGAARIAEMQQIEKAAAALGERELEMRAMLLAGISQLDNGQLADAEGSLKRAYQASIERGSVLIQIMALAMRSRVASRKGDDHEAMSFANLALDIADKPATPKQARARVYYEVAHAALGRAEGKLALERLRQSLELVHGDPHPLPYLEAGIRIDMVRALGMYDGRKQEALVVAREAAEWIEHAFGEHSRTYAIALGQVASVLKWNNEIAEALAVYRRSFAITLETSPPGDLALPLSKGDLARHLEANGLFEEARQLYAEELALAPSNELVRAFVPLITVRLGASTCAAGRCAEGYPLLERGLELGMAKYGADHDNVVEYRDALLDTQLELGKLAEAERNLEAMERIWKTDPARHALSLAMGSGMSRARILVDRKQPAAAEKLTRAALATWTELHGDDGPRAYLTFQLGCELVEQRRWADARATLAEATRVGARVKLREDFQAEIDVELARVDAATGQRAQALERARHAREVLARYPMSVHAHRELARLLDRR